ncbi:hypothetical protein ACFL3S_09815 [Gemmatimonadota bacterium]
MIGQAHESFRRLRDPAYLQVEPDRIRLVTVSRGMSLQALLAREGATSLESEVRLLNRIEGDGPLPVGRIVKIPSGGRHPGGR